MANLPYITVEDIRAYLEPQLAPGPEENALLDAIALRVTDAIERVLELEFDGYTLGERSVATYGTTRMVLPPYRAGSVTAVKWGTYTLGPETYREQDGALRTVSGLSWGVSVYNVTAQWGLGSPPPSLQQIALELAVNAYRSKDKGSFSETIGVEGSTDVRFVGGFTRAQRDILEAVRRQYRSRVVV